jgi:hypothetical protein
LAFAERDNRRAALLTHHDVHVPSEVLWRIDLP